MTGVSTLLNCTTIEHISVYNSFSTQDALTMLLCFCSTPSDEVQPLVVVVAPQLEDLLGPTVDLRLYDNLSISTGVNSFQPRPPFPSHFLIMNAMTLSSSSEKSFNDWYEDEHIPLLSGVPGWLDSGRYKLTISTTSHAPSCTLPYTDGPTWRLLIQQNTKSLRIRRGEQP